MFRINPTTNRITKLKEVRFADLGFNERGHLQEWLANQPDALGEDLLIRKGSVRSIYTNS